MALFALAGCERSTRVEFSAETSQHFVSTDESLAPGSRVFVRGSRDMWAERIVIAPDGNATWAFAGCTGTARREGGMIAGADRLELFEQESAAAMPRVHGYQVVSWSERTYLIDDSRLLEFANAINEGLEPQGSDGGIFLLEQGDGALPTSGLPALPSPWNDYLLAEPLAGHVIEVVAREDELDLVVDLGTEHGLKVGMKLWLLDAPVTSVASQDGPTLHDRAVWVIEAAPESSRCGALHAHHHAGARLTGLTVTTRPR